MNECINKIYLEKYKRNMVWTLSIKHFKPYTTFILFAEIIQLRQSRKQSKRQQICIRD